MSDEVRGQLKSAVMSKQAAIDAAASHVSPLLEIKSGRWTYHVWSTRESAWIPALRTDAYADARQKRTSTIAAMAADSLVRTGADLHDEQLALQIIGLAYSKENTGTVCERVNRILDRLSPPPKANGQL